MLGKSREENENILENVYGSIEDHRCFIFLALCFCSQIYWVFAYLIHFAPLSKQYGCIDLISKSLILSLGLY